MTNASGFPFRFAARAVGMSLAPLGLATIVFALAPSMLGDHWVAVFGVCIAVGLLATAPVRVTARSLVPRAIYLVVLLYALGFWVVRVLPSYFPENVSPVLFPSDDIGSFLTMVERANRMVVQSTFREHFVRETEQPDDLAAVISLIRKYPTGWHLVMSGAAGDYRIYLYRGGELLGSVGLSPGPASIPGQDTIFVNGSFRQIPRHEVARLTMKFGLKWPTR
jgi:hypothetical protein